MEQKAVETLIDARLSAYKVEIAELQRSHKAEVMNLLSAHKSEVTHMLAAHKIEVDAKLASAGTDIRNKAVDGLTGFVEETIAREMEEVQDTIMDRITSMPLRAELNFPDHPLF